jgi:hypothetical protein
VSRIESRLEQHQRRAGQKGSYVKVSSENSHRGAVNRGELRSGGERVCPRQNSQTVLLPPEECSRTGGAAKGVSACYDTVITVAREQDYVMSGQRRQ